MKIGTKIAIVAALSLPLFAACGSDREVTRRETTTTTYEVPQPRPVIQERSTTIHVPD